VQLRGVRADGNVVVVRADAELNAPRLTYDPLSHWIKADGTDQTPAVVTSGPRASGTEAREIYWNTQTWKLRVVDAVGRATPGR
jgi:hypothetical protein